MSRTNVERTPTTLTILILAFVTQIWSLFQSLCRYVAQTKVYLQLLVVEICTLLEKLSSRHQLQLPKLPRTVALQFGMFVLSGQFSYFQITTACTHLFRIKILTQSVLLLSTLLHTAAFMELRT
jgi:hypothetical protein